MVMPANSQVFPKMAFRESVFVRGFVIFLQVFVESGFMKKRPDLNGNEVLRFVVSIERSGVSHRFVHTVLVH